MATVTMKASELVEDFAIYPRNCVFDGHVYDLAECLRAGSVFPPIVADKKSKRITDGFHRRRTAIKVHGDDAQVEVQLIDYKSEAEMVADSIARNSSHGRRLTTADIARCVQLGKKFRISREKMADLLHITRDKLKDIGATRFANGKSGEPVLLRRPMSHLAGTQLTEKQEEVADHVGGLTAMTHANRLIDLIESQSLPDNEKLFDRLRHLHGLLESLLVAA